MALSDREKFIMHMVTVMTLASLGDPIDITSLQRELRKGRARKLTDEDVNTIWEDMKEEVINGRAIYEEMISRMDKDNKVFGVFKEDDGR